MHDTQQKQLPGVQSRPGLLDGLDLEMQADEGEDQALQILHQVVETPGTKHRYQNIALIKRERKIIFTNK